MPIDIGKLIDWLRLKPSIYVAIALMTGTILFAPEQIGLTLGLEHLRAQYRPWIGGAFLAAVTLWISSLLAMFANAVRTIWNQRKQLHARHMLLHDLTPSEQHVLRAYAEGEWATQSFALSNGTVSGLEARHILYRASNMGHPGSYSFPYNIQPWARAYLTAHSELLDSD